jgi:hypothetical protein
MSKKYLSCEQVKRNMAIRKQVVKELLERTAPTGAEMAGQSATELKKILERWVAKFCDEIDGELEKVEAPDA